MGFSHVVLESHFPRGEVARLETHDCSSQKLSLTVRSYRYMKDIMDKINDMKLLELNLVIEELEADVADHLAGLYQITKYCNLSKQNLQKFSLTYKADNKCGNNNAARFVIVTNLLNQLNWDSCKRVNVTLHFNYLNNDPRLDLLSELPVVLTVHGEESSVSVSKQDERSLSLIESTYSYLGGCL